MIEYWVKQTNDSPAFPDMLWSKPERRDQAGKLLIVGGNQHSFAATAEAFTAATDAGVGVCRVLLPNKLQRTVSKLFPPAEYGTSTPSGSFAKSALGEVLDLAMWGDGVLLAGDFGHNSETSILLESFMSKYTGAVTLTQDAVEYFVSVPASPLDRPSTTLVVTMAQLQKLATAAHFTPAITQSMDLLQLITALHDLTAKHPANIIVKFLDNLFVAASGQVSTTKIEANNTDMWRIKTAAHASVWLLQHPDQPFQALTTSLST